MRAIGVLLTFGSGGLSEASLVVDLNPADALFDSTTDNDTPNAGYSAASATFADGLTFNVTFTPSAGDLDSNTAAVNLIEVGGASNGTGIYLLGGEIHFLSKMNSNASQQPASPNDLDWNGPPGFNNTILVNSGYGPLAAGTEYTVATVFDPIGAETVRFGVSDNGTDQANFTAGFGLLNRGPRTNWSGNNTVTAFRGGNVFDLGGANNAGSNPFDEDTINTNPFEGVQGQALYWNATGAILVPEPTTALSLLAMLGCAFLRRGRRRVGA